MKRTMLMAAVLVLLGACAHSKEDASHLHHAGGVHHRFENAEQWAQRFEDPKRDEWQKPDEVIAALAVPKDGRVADIGAATGYFPVRIARAHPDATVYGVDIEPDMTKYLTERAQREGLPNVKAVLGEAADPKLPEAVDRVLLVDTYHHIDARPDYFRRLASSLREGGRVVIVDFKKGVEMGPPDEHKLAPEQVTSEMKEAGYTLVDQRDLPYQYILVFGR